MSRNKAINKNNKKSYLLEKRNQVMRFKFRIFLMIFLALRTIGEKDLHERQATFIKGLAKLTRESFMVIDRKFSGGSSNAK